MFSVLGDPSTANRRWTKRARWEIHRAAPTFAEQMPAADILETGIKVIDLIGPSIPRAARSVCSAAPALGKTV